MQMLFNRGLSLGKLGRYEDAIHSYDRVIELDPKNINTYNAKGSALEKLGRYKRSYCVI